MAIKNASDLLVYAKTASAVAQVTRIRVLNTDPIEVPDGGTTGTVKIDNITNGSGEVSDDISTAASTNTGSTVLAAITAVLTSATYDYIDSSGSDQTDGNYKYRDFTNGKGTTPNEPKPGIVPTLSIKNGTATLNENAIIIEIVTPGSSAIFDPVAFSTSASFSTNMDLRDVTNKDSGGWSESLGGLRSFEVSTDVLQSINPDVPLDGTDFFDKLKTRSLVDLSFSDRIRNILRTNLTQSGVDGFTISSAAISQTNLQTDAFGGSTGSKLTITGDNTFKSLNYSVDSGRIQGKYVTWSFYVKGDPDSPNNNEATFWSRTNNADVVPDSFEIISGDGSITGSNVKKISGLNIGDNDVVANWTRVRITYKFDGNQTATTAFLLAPGDGNDQDSGDVIYTSSWQIEFSPEATDYQDPTDITHWQGNALVSSLSFDAGVEDNLTCSATFTGTGNIYPNGLGPELIGDTGFDLANDGSNPASAYWSVFGASVVENGYGKILFTAGGAVSGIEKTGLMNVGDYYLLTYTVSSSPTPEGTLIVTNGWDQDPTDTQPQIPISAGTHKVLLKPGQTSLQIKRNVTTIDTTVWLSSISLKKVL
jgi:hypothetical protein